GKKSKYRLVAAASQFGSKVIESHSKRCAIQPTLGALSMRRGMPIPFQKHLYCKLFGPGVVADNTCNESGNSLVLGSKNDFKFGVTSIGIHGDSGFALRIHIRTTP